MKSADSRTNSNDEPKRVWPKIDNYSVLKQKLLHGDLRKDDETLKRLQEYRSRRPQ